MIAPKGWIYLVPVSLLAVSGQPNHKPTVNAIRTSVERSGMRVVVDVQNIEPGATIWLGGKPLVTERLADGRLSGTAPAAAAPGGLAVIQVRNPSGQGSSLQVVEVEVPNAVLSARAAGRFLEQATWGPTSESVIELRTMGFEKWLGAQFAAPLSDYPEPTNDPAEQSMSPVQRRFFYNCFNGQDQLRQRVAFALHQIWVVSANKTNQARMMIPYLRLLHQHAFGNYFTLMREMTLNPTMGRYLDMVNNVKPDPARGISANENYARELLQLFTIGTVKLNLDGTPVLDASGSPIPTYEQTTIEQLARVFTGWTYPPTPGQTSGATNPPYFFGRMVPWEPNHDTSAKTLLDGYRIPAGQSAEKELDEALLHLFNHPNVGPFLARRLIGLLVTGNPSPAYVARVAAAFNGKPGGVRGDMKAVIRAILLDPEARQGDDQDTPPTFGRLREPVLYISSLLRGLNATVAEANNLAARAAAMGQTLFYPPTVFNYFDLTYQPPALGGLLAPEFEILSPANALARANFADMASFLRLGPAVNIDLVPWINLATVHKWYLSEALNRVFCHRRMPEAVRDRILIALDYISDPALQVQTAVYLATSAMLYQVQN